MIKKKIRLFIIKKTLGIPSNTLAPWNYRFLRSSYLNKYYYFDYNQLKLFLRLDNIQTQLLTLTSELFQLHFKRDTQQSWDNQVQRFQVLSTATYQTSNATQPTLVGYLYLDLYQRPGKPNTISTFALNPDAQTQGLPEYVLSASFPMQSNTSATPNPTLTLQQTLALIHEFGHITHGLMAAQQPFAFFSGLTLENDALAVPAFMMEQWFWQWPIFRRIIAKPNNQSLTAAGFHRLKKNLYFGNAIHSLQQSSYARLSLAMHTQNTRRLNLKNLERDLLQIWSPFTYNHQPHYTVNMPHLGGEAANYYSLLWARAVASMFFASFQKNGLFHRPTLNRYQSNLLMAGSSLNSADMIQYFLGESKTIDDIAAAFSRSLP